MRIGGMRYKVQLQRKTVLQGRGGAKEERWQTIATFYADVNDIRGKEFFESGKVQSEVTTRLWIRYRTDVVPTMRIRSTERTYDILAVLHPNGKRQMLELMCKEVR